MSRCSDWVHGFSQVFEQIRNCAIGCYDYNYLHALYCEDSDAVVDCNNADKLEPNNESISDQITTTTTTCDCEYNDNHTKESQTRSSPPKQTSIRAPFPRCMTRLTDTDVDTDITGEPDEFDDGILI